MSDKKKCFIIMPFGKKGTPEFEHYLWIYQEMIKPVVIKHGYQAIRADELEHFGSITRDIISLIYEAYLVIADLSGKNANVFYELGVRHALFQCGTIPIIQDGEFLPFDIANYRTIFYSTDKNGPQIFEAELSRRIEVFEKTTQRLSDNPVHDIIGDKILQIDTAKREIANQQPQLKALQQEHTKIQQAYQTNLTKQQNFATQASQWAQEKEKYQAQIAELEQQLQAVNQQIQLLKTPPKPKQTPAPSAKPRFRSEKKPLSDDEVKKMLVENDFFDKSWNPKGAGFKHVYQEQELNGAKIIWDEASGLMWQQGGSPDSLVLKEAEDYIKKLNQEKFAGLNDWRLPTLEEAMSLMESKKNMADLYLDARFDANQRYIWTDDQRTGGSVRWVVYFDVGHCYNWDRLDDGNFVRAVRLGQSSTG